MARIGPININVVFDPLLPGDDTARLDVFSPDDYKQEFDEPFDKIASELTDLSVRLIELLPDPSLSPDERLERLARVVPSSQLVTANRRTARSKLTTIRRRLDELVPGADLDSREKLEQVVERLDELVPGTSSPIEKLERPGDFRVTDIGVSPREWK